MRIPVQLRLSMLATVGLSSLYAPTAAISANLFAQQEVDNSRFAVVASPYAGGTAHQLLIIEQVSNARSCWSKSGNQPTLINPLLTQFDFTNICGRSIDSNGYSLRTAGEDQGWRYSLRVVRRNNDMLLLGVPVADRRAPELLIGRVGGVTTDFAEIKLQPGWRLTKRSFNGQAIGHIYLTNDQPLASLNAAALASRPATTPIVSRPPASTTLQPSVSPAKPTVKPTTASTPTPPTSPSKPSPVATSGNRISIPIPVPPPETNQTNSTAGTFRPGNNDLVVPIVVVNR